MSGQRSSARIQVRSIPKHRQPKAPRPNKNVIPLVHQNESSTAKFYMFKYKIGNGRRSVSLNHGVYNYGTDRCPNSFNGSGRCPEGKRCRFAHSVLEILFHPLSYKTRMCSKREKCNLREGCAWAHSSDDFRQLQRILGRNWRLADPVTDGERKVMKEKKEKKKRNQTRVRLGGSEKAVSESASVMSTTSTVTPTATPAPRRPDTPSSATLTNMSVSTTPPLEEEKVREDQIMSAVDDDDNLSEFERWFGNAFDCDDDRKPFIGYLRRFEASGLDDVRLLWDLYGEMYEKFVELLVNEVGMADVETQDVFCTRLCEYVEPQSVREWMGRVVGLPQYVHMFEKFGTMDVLVHTTFDDSVLAEMGISSVGHRAKILLWLEREMD